MAHFHPTINEGRQSEIGSSVLRDQSGHMQGLSPTCSTVLGFVAQAQYEGILLKVAARYSRRLSSEQIGHIHGHLVDLCRIVELDVAQYADIITRHKVDSNALSSKASATSDAVNVVLSIAG